LSRRFGLRFQDLTHFMEPLIGFASSPQTIVICGGYVRLSFFDKAQESHCVPASRIDFDGAQQVPSTRIEQRRDLRVKRPACLLIWKGPRVTSGRSHKIESLLPIDGAADVVSKPVLPVHLENPLIPVLCFIETGAPLGS